MANRNHVEKYKKVGELVGRLGAELGGPMQAFGDLHQAAIADGALEAGASRQEIRETIGVPVVMGGGPSVVYGTEAYEALEPFENAMEPIN